MARPGRAAKGVAGRIGRAGGAFEAKLTQLAKSRWNTLSGLRLMAKLTTRKVSRGGRAAEVPALWR